MDFNFKAWGRRVLDIECDALKQLYSAIDSTFVHACERLYRCSGKVVVMGVGKSGYIGRKIAATLASTGTPAFFVHPSEANHGDIGMVSHNDVVLTISNSGEAQEIVTLIAGLKRLGTCLIAITGKPQSSLGQAADVHLCIGSLQEACPLGLAPTSSTTATLVMGDALAVALLQARGFSREDFARSHPGGMLGRQLLLRVCDLMQTGERIPRVSLTASLSDALLEMTRSALGMTTICDEKNCIKGIFTDGDLRRVFDHGIDLNNTLIREVMTPNGIRVAEDTLAVDALSTMQLHNITTLLVTADEQLLGVVHLYDILRSGVCSE